MKLAKTLYFNQYEQAKRFAKGTDYLIYKMYDNDYSHFKLERYDK